MPDSATLRLTWEPRMLSILRMMVGLLYMEHGLAKILDFPHQPNHAPCAPFTLDPSLRSEPPPAASVALGCCCHATQKGRSSHLQAAESGGMSINLKRAAETLRKGVCGPNPWGQSA